MQERSHSKELVLFSFKEQIPRFENEATHDRWIHFSELDEDVDRTDTWLCKTFDADAAPSSRSWSTAEMKLFGCVWLTPRIGDEVEEHDNDGRCVKVLLDSGWRKLKQRIVSSCELETIWNSSNWRRKTRPVCSVNVFRQSDEVWARGSRAAWRSQILILPSRRENGETLRSTQRKICLILPSYAPETIRLESKRMHRTSSSWPSNTRKHAPHSMSQTWSEREKSQYITPSVVTSPANRNAERKSVQSKWSILERI